MPLCNFPPFLPLPRPPPTHTHSWNLVSTNLLLVTVILLLLKFHVNGIHPICSLLCISSFIQNKVCSSYPCCLVLFIVEQYYTDWIYQNLFIHAFIDGYQDCFQFGASINKIARIIFAFTFLCEHTFSFSLGNYLQRVLLSYEQVYI